MTINLNYLPSFRKWMVICFVLLSAASNLNALDLIIFKYGKLKRDREVTLAFQTYKILPEHQYYISGTGDIPYAIIGVNSNYELRPGLWEKIELSTPLLRSWVSQMDSIYGYPPYGAVILDHQNNPVGIWYSSKQWTTIIIEDDNKVAILVPEPPGFRGGQ